MKKQYICYWLLFHETRYTSTVYSNGTLYGTNKKAMENEIRFMLKQKYKTKEFRDKYRCRLIFYATDDSLVTYKTIKSI